ncbi:MAG: hypothetical protein J0L79_03840 [Rickettsiales bacterium]|nr:hypothetical protein [Rickettsiales bacterium]MCA0254918.1 hypothetical protein [Pseudomonadota bacterium]
MMHIFDESFVIAICFIIFIYLAFRPVKKAIIASLDARIKEIKQTLSESEKVRSEAKQLLNSVEGELNNFEKKKTDLLANAQNSIERYVEIRNKEINDILERKKESALKSIEHETYKASSRMQSEFTNEVLDLVKKYLAKTKNNGIDDKEILEHLYKK